MLNGSREGLFLGAIAAARWVSGRRGTPGDPDSQSVLRRLCGRRGRRRLRAGLSAGDRGNRLPARPRRALRRAARAHRRLLHRLAGQPAGRGRRPRLSHAPRRAGAPLRLPGVHRRMLLARSTPGKRAAPACWRRQGPTSPTWSCSSRCPSARTCRGCASASPPATADSSRAFSSCATSPRRRCRCRRSRSRSPPMATRPMSKRTGGSTRRNSISPTRSSATATAIGGRPAASSSGSTYRRRAATRRSRCGSGARRAARRPRPLSRARPGRRLQSRPRLHPRRHGAGQGDHGRGAASPRRGAGLRAEHAGNRSRSSTA